MLYIITAAIVLVADILTKILAVKKLAPVYSVKVIKNILNFTYVENKGIAFGMFSGGRFAFIAITIAILILIILIIFKTPKEKRSAFLKFGGALVVGGAIGNLVDRVLYGYVVDFIEVKFIDFPVFNVADIAVCIGAGLLLIHYLFIDGKNNVREENADD